MTKYTRRLALGLLGIALATSLFVAFRRWVFEAKNANIEVVVSFRDMTKLSQVSSVSLPVILEKLRDSKLVSSIAIEEESIETMVAEGHALFLSGAEMGRLYQLGGLSGSPVLMGLMRTATIEPRRYYIVLQNPNDFKRLLSVFNAEMGSQVQSFPDLLVISVIGDELDLLELGVGFSTEKMDMIRSYGFSLIPRFRNSVRVNSELVKVKFSALASADLVDTIIFEGTTVLGYPKNITDLKKEMGHFGYNFGVIEFADQSGINGLATYFPNSVLSVHSFSDAEIENLSTDTVIYRYLRAVKERNNKILFLKPYYALTFDSMGNTLLSANMAYFSKVVNTLRDDGYVIKPIKRAVSDDYVESKSWERLLIGLGVGSLIWMLFGFFGISGSIVFYGISAAVVGSFLVFFGTGHGVVWSQLTALMAAIATPTLAGLYFFRAPIDSQTIWRRFFEACGRVSLAFLTTVMGALMVVGLLSEYAFVAGTFHFMGVKIAFLVPLVLLFLYYYVRPNRLLDIHHLIRRILGEPVRYSALMMGVGMVVFFTIYIIRSGNYLSVDADSSEHYFRQILETIFSVRPRTKEMLIGYPLLMSALLIQPSHLLYRWRWMMVCLGGVAYISVFNSFCHIHTPLVLTMYRSMLGLIMGFLCVALGVLGWIIIRWGKRYVGN